MALSPTSSHSVGLGNVTLTGAAATGQAPVATSASAATWQNALALHGASCFNNAVQSIPSQTETAMTWNSENFDTDGFHSTVSNTSRITIPTGFGGYYAFGGVYRTNAPSASSSFYAYLRKNGATVIQSLHQISTTQACSLPVVAPASLVATDYVELIVFNGDTGAVNSVANSCQFWCYLIGL